MAWTSYHGQHRISAEGPYITNGEKCFKVVLRKKGSAYKDHFASVCESPQGTWRYSGHASHGRAIYGDFATPKGAIKAAIRSNRSWIGEDTMRGARKRGRR